ncbi:DUF317 domain-containing protein [Streptomyces sp. NPDC058451]|uniref:DUF317 domain-containing protein n=1 Tax=Streptomyces sp. NPDC058451 TaxID=3346506 RepID=UPI00364D5768
MVTAATQPLSDAGWRHTADGRWIYWTSPAGDAGVQFEAFTAQLPSQNLATWTVWAGSGPDPPACDITASQHTPNSLLAEFSEPLSPKTGTRQAQPTGREPRTSLVTSAPTAPGATAGPTASRSHGSRRATAGQHSVGSPVGQTGDPTDHR